MAVATAAAAGKETRDDDEERPLPSHAATSDGSPPVDRQQADADPSADDHDPADRGDQRPERGRAQAVRDHCARDAQAEPAEEHRPDHPGTAGRAEQPEHRHDRADDADPATEEEQDDGRDALVGGRTAQDRRGARARQPDTEQGEADAHGSAVEQPRAADRDRSNADRQEGEAGRHGRSLRRFASPGRRTRS